MQLQTIDELLKRRKKLIKLLGKSLPPLSDDPGVAAHEKELNRLCRKAVEQHIADIDAEIAERTGAKPRQR